MKWIEYVKENSGLEEGWNTLPAIAKLWFEGQIDAFVETQVQNRVKTIPSLQTINFQEMRKEKRLTLREVEEITGISNSYLSQLETGKIKSPSYDVVKTLYELYTLNT